MWQGIRGLCDSCRQLLCDDRPFNCNAQNHHDDDGWSCTSCFNARAEAKGSECTFSRKPTKIQKDAFRIFAQSNPEDLRASTGNHLQSKQAISVKGEAQKASNPMSTIGLAPDVFAPRPLPERSEWGLFTSHRPPTPPDSPQVFQRAVIPQAATVNSSRDDQKFTTSLQVQPGLENSLINTASEPFAVRHSVDKEAQYAETFVALPDSQAKQLDPEPCADAIAFKEAKSDRKASSSPETVAPSIVDSEPSDLPENALSCVRPISCSPTLIDDKGHRDGAQNLAQVTSMADTGLHDINGALPVSRRKCQTKDERSPINPDEIERMAVSRSASSPTMVAKRRMRPTTLFPKEYYPTFLAEYADNPFKRAKKFHASPNIHDTASKIKPPKQLNSFNDIEENGRFHSDVEITGNSLVEVQTTGKHVTEVAADSQAHEPVLTTVVATAPSQHSVSDVDVDFCMIDQISSFAKEPPTEGIGTVPADGMSKVAQNYASATQTSPPDLMSSSEAGDAPPFTGITEATKAELLVVPAPLSVPTAEPVFEESDAAQSSTEVQNYNNDSEGKNASAPPEPSGDHNNLSMLVTRIIPEVAHVPQSLESRNESSFVTSADVASVGPHSHPAPISTPSSPESGCEARLSLQTLRVSKQSEEVSAFLANPRLDESLSHKVFERTSSLSPSLVAGQGNGISGGRAKTRELRDSSESPVIILKGDSIPPSWRASKARQPQQSIPSIDQNISPLARQTENVEVSHGKQGNRDRVHLATSSDRDGSAPISFITADVGAKEQNWPKSNFLDAASIQDTQSATGSLRWVSENISKPVRPRQVHDSTGARTRKSVLRPCKRCSEFGEVCDQAKPTCNSCREQGTYCEYPRRKFQSCELCRHRKTSCNKAKPVCRQCQKSGVTCVYPVATGLSISKSDPEFQTRDLDRRVSWSCSSMSNLVPPPLAKEGMDIDSTPKSPASKDGTPAQHGKNSGKANNCGHDPRSMQEQRLRLSELAEKIKGSSLYMADRAEAKVVSVLSSPVGHSKPLDQAPLPQQPEPQSPRSQNVLQQTAIPAASDERLSETMPITSDYVKQRQKQLSHASKLEMIVPSNQYVQEDASTPTERAHHMSITPSSPILEAEVELGRKRNAKIKHEIIDLTQPKPLSLSIGSLLNGSMVEPKTSQYRDPRSRSRSISYHSSRPNSSSGPTPRHAQRTELEPRPRSQQRHHLPRTPSPLHKQYYEPHSPNEYAFPRATEPAPQTALTSPRNGAPKPLSRLAPQLHHPKPNSQADLRPPHDWGPPSHSRTGSLPHQYSKPISPTASTTQRQREQSLPPRISYQQQQQPHLSQQSHPWRLPSVICAESEAAYSTAQSTRDRP